MLQGLRTVVYELGATAAAPIHDVGDGIRLGTVTDPAGNTLGVIDNPHFRLPDPV